MPTIELDQVTYDRLAVTARLLDQPVGAVVKLLVDRLATEPAAAAPPAPMAADPASGQVAVHALYKSERIEGRFHPGTLQLEITSSPWSGRAFTSPTAAAQAVVAHFSSDRQSPNTNGRRFWKVSSTGHDLRSLIGERF